MRAQLVFEKFTEEGDPIADMSIGVFYKLKPLDIIKCKKRIKPRIKNTQFNFFIEPGMYSVIKQIYKDGNDRIFNLSTYDNNPQKYFKEVDIEFSGDEILSLTSEQFFDHFEIVKSDVLTEKFTEDSDPIDDMGIGMLYQIKKWVKSIGVNFEDKNKA